MHGVHPAFLVSGARFSAVYRMSRSRKWDGESRNLKSVAPQRPAPTLCKTASPLPQRIADCGHLANCGNPAFLYPFVISYAVKTKVDTDYQMTCQSAAGACRAPRIRPTEYTPAVIRFQSGDSVTGNLEVISSTGGLLRLSKPLILGTRIKLMFLTENGPVLGTAEMLSAISWTHQPFRFVALTYGDQRRLQAVTGCSSKLEMPIPEPTSRIPDSELGIVDTEHQWIDKYRAAVARNPPRRPLLKRMLGTI